MRESGKSTTAKQMKIIHQNGFSQEELLTYQMLICMNLVDSAKAIILAMWQVGIDCEMPSNRVSVHSTNTFWRGVLTSLQPNCNRIIAYQINADPASKREFIFGTKIANFIHQLWQEPVIPKVMDHSSEFNLMELVSYFFIEAVRIGVQGYVPTETDVLSACQKTVGITETQFSMGQVLYVLFCSNQGLCSLETSIHMFDISGQRSKRKR